MNLDLQLRNAVLSSAPESDVMEGSIIDQKAPQADSFSERPSMEDLLRYIGPLPSEALLLGLADDGLPVLLNMWDPTPGPILVAGDAGSGKTDFLKVIAGFVLSSRQPREVQYGVITDRPHEWHGHVESGHCIGIFSMSQQNVTKFVQALTVWIDMARTSRQSVLLLMDGLEDFAAWDGRLNQNLQKILLHGPAKKLWPVVTLNLESCHNARPWLKYFRTRVFGHSQHASFIDDEAGQHARCGTLSKGREFSLKEASQWIRFRIPSI
jgi:hypothetical protein